MGEKEIDGGGAGGGATGVGGGAAVGGGPGTTQGPGLPPDPFPPGGGGGGSPGTRQRDPGGGGSGEGQRVSDCADLEARNKELIAALDALRQKNQQFADKAVDDFYRNEGYRDTVQKTMVTEAVVDSNNKVGKGLIDIALFAAGGYGGVGQALGGSAATMEGMFGAGIYGSKDAGAAIQGIGAFLGKLTGTEIGGKEVEGGPLGGMADKAKNAVLDGIGDWMKEGATAPGIEAAKQAYAAFVGDATAANAAAAGALDVKRQLDDVVAQAQAKNCPLPPVPNPILRTFALTPFGQGAERGRSGPTLHTQTLSGDSHLATDMFQAGSKGMLPGY